MKIFTNDFHMISHGVTAIRLYFFGFYMMAFQMSGQAVAVGLGKSK